MKINLGCGHRPFAGYINVDIMPYAGVDVIMDIEHVDRLQFADGSAEEIYAGHLFEHLSNPVKLLLECWRVLEMGGHLALVLPNIAADRAFADRDFGVLTGLGFAPDEMPGHSAHDLHRTYWIPESLRAFVEKFGFEYSGIINLEHDQRVTKSYQWQFGQEYIKVEFPLIEWYRAYLRQRATLERNGQHG